MKIALVFCEIDKLFEEYKAGVFSIFESNPPLGLGAIATTGVIRGHEVKLYDQQLLKYTNDKIVEKLEDFQPDIVGFSCTSLNIQNAVYCAEKIKQYLSPIVFAGGIHVTMCTDKVNNLGVFDILVSGEGEEVFEEVLSQLEKSKVKYHIDIKGLSLKGQSTNNGVAVLSTIDQPMIDRNILEIHRYKNKGALLKEVPCYSLFSSRGCPFTCKFCSKPDYFKIYRQREVENVIDEIKYLIKDFGAKAVSFREDNFTVDLERLKSFCERMIMEFDGEFYWECESRADMPREILELMYRAGCRGIWCGVETIVLKWQKWINKGISKEAVVKFYHDCNEIGIKTGALFMFGFPDQTQDEINEDIDFAISLPTVFSAFQCLAIFPGSPLADFYRDTDLCYYITEEVALALIKGKTCLEMIEMEKAINTKISSARLNYKDKLQN